MKPVVVQGTILKCSFGNLPTALMVLPERKVNSMTPVATKADHIPFVNILPFGMCSNPANPMVIAATAAAMGTPTPAPCIPCTLKEWDNPCKKVMVHGVEAINMDSCLKCVYGGEIRVTAPIQPLVVIE